MKVHDIDVVKSMNKMTITFRPKRCKEAVFRIKIAGLLVRLAAKISGMNYREEEDK